jgi:predicted MFS family arabinose efflux permease
VLGAVSVGLLVAFVVRQARIANPLMPLRLFRSRNTTGANLVMVFLVVGMFGVFFLGALYLQQILGYEPLEVGLAFLPSTLGMGALSLFVAGRLAMRFGPKPVLVASLPLIAAGLALFTRAPVDGSYLEHVLPVTVLLGVGAGLATPALMMLAMSAATPEDAGMASGLVNTTTQVGGAIGLAVLATLAAGRTASRLADGASESAALNAGFHLAYLVAAGMVALSVLVALFVLRSPQTPAAQELPVVEEEPEVRELAQAC